ncbi:MAG: fasciclin domain-containing protein [Acidimicrobiia bacterium]|nr:fasciclin domain-containing protein [Acidimicrobiia bacterium]
MKKTTRTAASLMLSFGLVAAACASDDPEASVEETTTTTEAAMELGNIAEVATQAGSFSTLLAAAEAADLVGPLTADDELTVFAPTDEAFGAALEALDLSADQLLASPLLGDILLYHIVAGEVKSDAVVALDGQAVETLNGATVAVSVDGSSVKVNDANVVTVDVDASNGVIHVIDAVLLPADAAAALAGAMEDEDAMEEEDVMEDVPATVVDIASSSDDFSILVEAVVAADLAGTLSGEGPFTVFAPTNDAFADALVALDLTKEELLASPDLAGILTYHVVPATVLAADAVAADGTEVPTVNGDTIEVSVVDGMVMVDGATVTATDLIAGNGVVHVIDAVILPGS